MTQQLKDEEFAQLYQGLGTAGTAQALGISERACRRRKLGVEGRLDIDLGGPYGNDGGVAAYAEPVKKQGARIEIPDFKNGKVLIGSDAHNWPGEPSTSHKAFVLFCKKFQPEIVIMNGDVIDAACISRFPPIGWESLPTVKEELDVCKVRLGEISDNSNDARFIWSLGNHDARFETRLASVAPEFKHVHGVHLKDHFPDWEPCWSVFIGGEKGAVIKHRFKGGMHAPQNNVLWSGRTMITGHLHSQKVIPVTDYNGTRWGVDSGCMSPPHSAQFKGYTEDNPLNWREGFCMLTFKDGELLPPELISVWKPGVVTFRGELIDV